MENEKGSVWSGLMMATQKHLIFKTWFAFHFQK